MCRAQRRKGSVTLGVGVDTSFFVNTCHNGDGDGSTGVPGVRDLQCGTRLERMYLSPDRTHWLSYTVFIVTLPGPTRCHRTTEVEPEKVSRGTPFG